MIFFADEGLDFPLVSALRSNGFIVIYAAEDFPAVNDKTILEEAVKKEAVLITKDKDFGEMVIRRQLNSCGVVLIRIDALNDAHNINLVVKLLLQYIDELPYSFTVIQEDKIRIRKLNERT